MQLTMSKGEEIKTSTYHINSNYQKEKGACQILIKEHNPTKGSFVYSGTVPLERSSWNDRLICINID
jgi:hypothetical protein